MDIAASFHTLIPRYQELKGQVAVVTGGAKGIGQGIVMRLAREEMRVVVADIDKESLTTTVDSLRHLGVEAMPFHGDLGQSSVTRQLFEQTEAEFGGVDLLVNNAASLERSRLLDENEELLELQLNANIRGPYLCSLHAANDHARARRGQHRPHLIRGCDQSPLAGFSL